MKAKEKLHETLSEHLERIAALYKVRPRITLIVRMPNKPDQTVFLSDDNWSDAMAAVKYLSAGKRQAAGDRGAPMKTSELLAEGKALVGKDDAAALDLSFMPRAEPVIKDSLKTARVVLPEVHVPRASHEVSTVFPAPGSLRVDITSRAGGTIRFGAGGYVGSGGGFVIDEVSLVRPPGPRLGQPDEIEGGE